MSKVRYRCDFSDHFQVPSRSPVGICSVRVSGSALPVCRRLLCLVGGSPSALSACRRLWGHLSAAALQSDLREVSSSLIDGHDSGAGSLLGTAPRQTARQLIRHRVHTPTPPRRLRLRRHIDNKRLRYRQQAAAAHRHANDASYATIRMSRGNNNDRNSGID